MDEGVLPIDRRVKGAEVEEEQEDEGDSEDDTTDEGDEQQEPDDSEGPVIPDSDDDLPF